jgi:CRISPR/Cas system type I-B associated protein Csh2 (Cas7 group RAMP superfamily)
VQALIIGAIRGVNRTLSHYKDMIEAMVGGINISEQALAKGFTKEAVELMKKVFIAMMEIAIGGRERGEALLRVYRAIYIIDTTIIELPETMKKAYRGYG